ncbi:hypothetical protein D9615_000597 [Tricholomella constricta]|uniref:GH16 domain-containing protein n=1 Tax=Tricholomella constricta TaxID=117010 RepID=A0A8H5HR28_9AGAR|nr:hypothetical protein D9615_000597 [Tricholomella constricta]
MDSPHPADSPKSPPSTPVRSLHLSASSPFLSPSISYGKLYRESWFSLSPDPRLWGSDLSTDLVETDDEIHNPDVQQGKLGDAHDLSFSRRGVANLGCLIFLITGFLMLFIGYPVISYARKHRGIANAFSLGGINSTGQVPSMGNFGLIDLDTPEDAHFRDSRRDGSRWQLVFSDEFNTDGRSFYPGDDPYWEAADLHYWVSLFCDPGQDFQWYDPAAVTTEDGALVITFSEMQTHGLNYQGGLISSWNKFCFTGGMIETSVQLPGANNIVGMWPAIWTLGNLGRAGYGATLEGMALLKWPYTYDACDVGTAPNQTLNGEPYAATIDGDPSYGDALSYLPGQRLSRCTCADDTSHPGPKHTDGTFVGRAAPEIDVFEAQVTGKPLRGQVSQSAQFAPFNRAWIWQNTSDNEIIANPAISVQNNFVGSATQQANSVVTDTNQQCYELNTQCYSVYGFEYKPGYDDAYISWISENLTSWTMNAPGVGPDPSVSISSRAISQEPMYLIINLGMSRNFGYIDFEHLTFPNHLRVDYIRIYQPPDAVNIGCSPPGFPTEAYINKLVQTTVNSVI